MHCVRIGQSVGSKTTGSDPPSGLVYRVGGFSHISCTKSLRGGTRTVPGFSSFKTVLKVCSQTKSLPENSAYSCVFEPENVKLFGESESKIPPFDIRILPYLERLTESDWRCALFGNRGRLSAPTVRFDLNKLKKDAAVPETYRVIFTTYYRMSVDFILF